MILSEQSSNGNNIMVAARRWLRLQQERRNGKRNDRTGWLMAPINGIDVGSSVSAYVGNSGPPMALIDQNNNRGGESGGGDWTMEKKVAAGAYIIRVKVMKR